MDTNNRYKFKSHGKPFLEIFVICICVLCLYLVSQNSPLKFNPCFSNAINC